MCNFADEKCKLISTQRLGKNVCQLKSSGYLLDSKGPELYMLPNKVEVNLNLLSFMKC